MNKSGIRVLVVDDNETWRRYHSIELSKQQRLQIVGEASDGLEAVQQAQATHPDLILLDIGLPRLNGIEAARRIREVSPASRILFVSENRSPDIAEEALRTGARGYVVKSDAGSELLAAVDAVLEGKRFISPGLAAHRFRSPDTGSPLQDNVAILPSSQNVGVSRKHEAEFYSDDASLLDGFTKYIGSGLMTGKAVIVVATESHRDNLLLRLQAHGVNIAAAIEEGRCIPLDAADTLSTFMVNGSPDPIRFQKAASDLIVGAAEAVKGDTSRVAACGECAPLLWMQGNVEASLRVEHLWDVIAITLGSRSFFSVTLTVLRSRKASPKKFLLAGRYNVMRPCASGKMVLTLKYL